MRLWKPLARILCLALVGAGLSVAVASPAAAHDGRWEIRTCCVIRGEAAVKYSHTRVLACDYNADNITVYVQFFWHSPNKVDDIQETIHDENGSRSGCTYFDVPPGGYVTLLRGWADTASTDGWVRP